MREVSRRSMRWLVGPRSLRRYWPALGVLGPLALNVPAHAFAAQARAILDTDDSLRDRLVEVRVPTLVVSGSQDILTPTADGEELAERIPGAGLSIISGAAHGFPVEHALAFNKLVLEFLAAGIDESADA
jgi:3-oxoadipate enol-lactonase